MLEGGGDRAEQEHRAHPVAAHLPARRALEHRRAALAAGHPGQREDGLDALLVALFVALRLVEHHRHGVAANRLAQPRFCRRATHHQGEIAKQGHDVAIEDRALARSRPSGEPEVGPPGQGPTDRCQHHPAHQQGAGGRHIPAEAVGDPHNRRRLSHRQRFDAPGPLQVPEALVNVPRAKGFGDRMLPLWSHQPIAQVQHAAAVIPPGPAAADALGSKDADRSGALVQVTGHRGPVHAGAAGVQGFPVAQGCQGHQLGGGVGRTTQPQDLAGAAGLVVAGLAVVAEALERSRSGAIGRHGA